MDPVRGSAGKRLQTVIVSAIKFAKTLGIAAKTGVTFVRISVPAFSKVSNMMTFSMTV